MRMINVEKLRFNKMVSENVMFQAVNSVLVNGLSIREVSRQTGINRTTLGRYIQKKKEKKSDVEMRYTPNYGVRKFFSNEQETVLAKYIKNCSNMSFGFGTISVRKLAFQFAERNKISIPISWKNNQVAGRDWLREFLKRQHLSIRKPEACSLSRMTSFNPHNVNNFFQNLEKTLIEYPTINDSQGFRIFNLDETGTTTVQTPQRVIAEKGCKQVSRCTSSERGVLVTTCCIIGANGTFLPPAIVFPRKNFKSRMTVGAPNGTLGLATSSGWMTADVFIHVLDHFIKHTNSSKENPSLLIYDNHESHVSLDAIDKARENGVVLLTLTPHCSHKMQPLDVGVYQSFKAAYNKACDSWMFNNAGHTMTIYNISPLIHEAFYKSMTPANILSGFRKSGIHPFNPNIFTESDFLQASVTDRPFVPAQSSAHDPVPSTSNVNSKSQELSSLEFQFPENISKFESEIKVVEAIIDH